MEDDEVMCLQERVSEAQRLAKMVNITKADKKKIKIKTILSKIYFYLQNMKDMGTKKGKSALGDDEEGAMGVRRKHIGNHKSNKSKKFKNK